MNMDSTTYPFALPVTYKVNDKDAKRDYSKEKLTIIWNSKTTQQNNSKLN